MTLLLGVDIGGTATKAVLFDVDGNPLAHGSVRSAVSQPCPGWVERDMDDVWSAAAGAIRECLDLAGDVEVAAVAVVGHSDGLYPIDAAGRPTRRAIMATDARAAGIVDSWVRDGIGDEALQLTGVVPFAASPAPLMAWLREVEPDTAVRTRWFLAAKDWIRLCLTGHIGADPTDASGSFLDVRTRAYSAGALELFGLSEFAPTLAPIAEPSVVVASVSAPAAALTGLREGTPVVTGAHDVDAAAAGMGAIGEGALSVIIGTFSINQTVTLRIELATEWQLRQFLVPGELLAMSTSPTSASNLEWYAATLGLSAADAGALIGEAAQASANDRLPCYLPFVHGATTRPAIGGAFVGLGGHHRRGDMVKAVLSGVVAQHRWHVEQLGSRFALPAVVNVGGGGAQSTFWLQLLADALDRVVHVHQRHETARGAAVLAGLGVDAWASLQAASSTTATAVDIVEPRDYGVEQFDRYYERYRRAIEALQSIAE